MYADNYTFGPDYAISPGQVLEQELETRGISQAEFARRCSSSPKLIGEIIAGKAPVEPEMAVQSECVLAVDAGIWLSIEAKYRERLAEQSEGN